MTYFYLTLFFVFLAGFFNAIMDKTNSHFEKSIFKFFNNKFWGPNSWTNKYINNDYTKGRKKLFGIINYPIQLTDGWHLVKFFMVLCYSLAIYFSLLLGLSLESGLSIIKTIFYIILNWWIFGLSFTLFFTYLFDLKFWKNIKNILTHLNNIIYFIILLTLIILGIHFLMINNIFVFSLLFELLIL